MRSRLRLFLLVGLAATALDIGTLLALQDRGLVAADVVALTLAATVAYLLNRHITFRRRPLARWVRRPTLFGATALAAGLVDVAVLTALSRLGLAVLAAKVLAVGAAATVRWVAYRRILFHQVRQEMAQRLDRPPAPGAKRLSVVVPAYNEGELIEGTLAAIRAEVDPVLEPGSYEILVVDDGSTDDTAERARAAGANVLSLAANQGKGGAVRAGMLAADGRTVVFTDADLAYSPRLVLEVLDRVENGWDVVVGSRRHDDTNTLVRARHLRELGGRVINVLTHLVLLGKFHDTQCGIKGFRGDIARAVFERTRINGFAFDVEIFLIAEQDQLSLTEIPVSVTNRAASSVRIVGDTAELLVDLFRIRRWAGEGRYRPTAAQAEILHTGSPIS
ncbi:MAG: glycosyltransferase [Acidimicrobiales bacterium]